MSNRREGAGATVLDGKIYVAGGYNGSNYLNTVEMSEFTYLLTLLSLIFTYSYDERANAWSSVLSMNNARYLPGLVSDGRRLFAIGGYGNGW